MFTVYVLYSPSFDTTYTGFSSNLQSRFLSHNFLSKKDYTVRYRPWLILYTEECADKRQAMKRERYLKSGSGRAFIKRLVNDWKKSHGIG
jgi:putative endonuclease